MIDNKLLIIGCGGHAHVAYDCAVAGGLFSSIEVCCNAPGLSEAFDSLCPLEQSEAFANLSKWDSCFVAIGNSADRETVSNIISSLGGHLAILIHPSAAVSPSAALQGGTIVCAGANVGPSAQLGMGCIINTGADVEHDCCVGDWCHLSPHSVMCGGSKLGERSWLCASSCVSDHVSFPANSTLAAGSAYVVESKISGLYAGLPAILAKKYKDIDM